MSIKEFFRREAEGMREPWETWHDALSLQSAHASHWIADLAHVRAGMTVLDLASGVGDPALVLARLVGESGRVTATDLVPRALELLELRARRLGLNSITTECADMECLPFASRSFDAATCRLGVMFCADPRRALSEVRRVLKPGARAAFIVWGSTRQPLFESIPIAMGAEDQGPFRFARASTLAAALRSAGFSHVSEDQRVLSWPFHGPARDMWAMFKALAGPSFAERLALLGDSVRADLDARAIANFARFHRDGIVDPTATLIGCAGVA